MVPLSHARLSWIPGVRAPGDQAGKSQPGVNKPRCGGGAVRIHHHPARKSLMDWGAFGGALGRTRPTPMAEDLDRGACGGALGRNGTSPLPPDAVAVPRGTGLHLDRTPDM